MTSDIGRLFERAHFRAYSMRSARFSLFAAAKVNLRLKVLGRRSDGYHVLSMLNATSSLCDELTVSLSEEPTCVCSVEPSDRLDVRSDDNLVTRAFRYFWREFGCDDVPCGVRVTIEKRIPIGGGLGGGSSDAGAMLRWLGEMFGSGIRDVLRLSNAEYEACVLRAALACGADVPFAYRGGICWVRGIGDVVQPFVAHRCWLAPVLITVPPDSVSTALFYEEYRHRHPVIAETSDDVMCRFYESPVFSSLPSLLENDFEDDVARLVPSVGEGLAIARRFFPRTTSLTGSGSAFFSLVPPGEEGRIPTYLEAAEKKNMTVHLVQL